MNSSKSVLARAESYSRDDLATPVVISQPAAQWAEAGAPGGRNLASYLEIPFVNKRLIVTCTVLGLLCGWLAILVWPRSYESVAKMKMKIGRESVALDPTATTGSTLMALQKTQAEEIKSLLEVLNSRQVAEQVVDALGTDVIMSGELPRTAGEEDEIENDAGFERIKISDRLGSIKSTVNSWLFPVLLAAGIKDEVSDRELAILRIQGSVEIESPKQSSVVVIKTGAATPEMAQAIVKEVTRSFLSLHLQGSHTEGSYEFFAEQSADVENELNELVAARAKFMQENKIVSIDTNRTLISNQLSGVNRDLGVAEGGLEQTQSEVEDIEAKMHSIEDEIISAKSEAGDVTWSGMRQQVYALELEEQNHSAILREGHPRLKRVRAQLNGAKEILKQLESDRIDEIRTPNPIKTDLQQELQRKQTQIVGLRSVIEENDAQRSELVEHAKQLLEHERHLTQLDREIELKTSSLRMMRKKKEESRVIDELNTDKFSNIHVFQPATYAERAVSPKKKILGVGFVFLGMTMGLALSFLREGSSPTLRTPDDVELRLCAPVVSNIPRLKHMRSPRLKEQRRYRKICDALMAEILMSQHRPGHTRGRSLGIIGVDVGAGASTLAVNLAVASDVDCHLKTVLVDADSRRRSVSKMFGLNGSPGLVELVSGAASHDECLQKVKKSDIELIASSADSCDELLSSSAPEIVQALQAYLHDCDLLIVDLPAASQPDQAVALAQHLDCILVVAESEKTDTAAADRLLNRLSQSDTEIVGVVLTKTRSYLPKFIRSFVAPRV